MMIFYIVYGILILCLLIPAGVFSILAEVNIGSDPNLIDVYYYVFTAAFICCFFTLLYLLFGFFIIADVVTLKSSRSGYTIFNLILSILAFITAMSLLFLSHNKIKNIKGVDDPETQRINTTANYVIIAAALSTMALIIAVATLIIYLMLAKNGSTSP